MLVVVLPGNIFSMKFFYTVLLGVCSAGVFGQGIIDEIAESEAPKSEPVTATFKSTRLLHGHTVEMTKPNALDFRIAHRFGDMATPGTNVHTLFGLYSAADIAFTFDYGINKDLSVGLGWNKGTVYRESWFGNVKYKVLKQTKDFKIPLTITLLAQGAVTGVKRQNSLPSSLEYLPKWYNRFSYTVQAMIAVKATDWLSIQLTPSFVWRNFVTSNDKNGLFVLGLSARAKVSKRCAIVFEYFQPITRNNATFRQYFPMLRGIKNAGYYAPLNLGFEIETGGHVFQINLTNTAGLLEQDYLAYNPNSWAQGQFRLGFCIARTFQFGKGINPWTGRYKKKVREEKKAKDS